MWQTEIGYCGSYFALLLLPLKTWKSEFKKTTNKKWWRYLPFTHLNQKPQSYEAQLLNYRVKQTEFIFILGHFLPFTGVPLTTQKIRILRKWKWRIFLHLCTKNHCCMMYPSWEMECNRQLFVILLNFYPTIDPKIKIWKKWKKHLKILSFYTCVPWMKIIWCMVPEIWCVTGRIFSFWTIFCPLTLLTTQKMKILKKWE